MKNNAGRGPGRIGAGIPENTPVMIAVPGKNGRSPARNHAAETITGYLRDGAAGNTGARNTIFSERITAGAQGSASPRFLKRRMALWCLGPRSPSDPVAKRSSSGMSGRRDAVRPGHHHPGRGHNPALRSLRVSYERGGECQYPDRGAGPGGLHLISMPVTPHRGREVFFENLTVQERERVVIPGVLTESPEDRVRAWVGYSGWNDAACNLVIVDTSL